jgi:hypothetical protein
MSKSEVIQLIWGGRETSVDVLDAMQRGAEVEITLPANVHHTLYQRLYPDAARSAPEIVDLDGGTELIETLASIAGLEAMADLTRPLASYGYMVQLRSPGTLLSLIPQHRA